MNDNEAKNSMKWIKPLATFEAKVSKGTVIEIPAYVRNALEIEFNDVVEVAYAGIDTNVVIVFNAVVGARDRIGLRRAISTQSNILIGDIVLVGILSVYKNRSDNLVVVFDVDAQPGTME